MPEPMSPIEVERLSTVVLSWVALLIVASIVYRRAKGKSIFATVPRDALFVEKWTSGRSLRNSRAS